MLKKCRCNWVNFLSLCLVFVSGTMWYFLLPAFMGNASFNKEEVKVEGQSWSKTEIEKKEQGKNGKDFDSKVLPASLSGLLKVDPLSPVRNEGVGDFYARASSAIALDAKTGTILHFQAGKEKRAIASLTKVVTAVLVMENIKNLNTEVVTIDEEAYSMIGTKVGCPGTGNCVNTRLQVGEQVYAINLLEAMLMNSANDAAVALAKHISGSVEGFADAMNDKALSLGLKDTHFCNPSGLDDDDNPGSCYSTAYDYARLVSYALKYDLIWDIMKIKEKEFDSVDGVIHHKIANTDVLLDELPNCVGGKTGFTYEAGRSLMMTAYQPDNKKNRVIAVFLNDDYRWEDMRNFFDWVFKAYNWPK